MKRETVQRNDGEVRWGKESMRNVGIYLKLILSSPKLTMASPDTDGILKVCFSHFIISSKLDFKWLFLPLLLYDFYLWIVGPPQRRNNSVRDTDPEAKQLLDFESKFSHLLVVHLWTSALMSLYLSFLNHKRYVMVERVQRVFWEARIKSVNCSEVTLVYRKLLLLSNLT